MNCYRNPIMYKSVKIGTSEQYVEISVDQTILPDNKECVSLVICQNLPVTTKPLPIVLTINNQQYYVLTRCGNFVFNDQVRTRRKYILMFSDRPDLFILQNGECLCPTKYIPTPPTPPPIPSSSGNKPEGRIDIIGGVE